MKINGAHKVEEIDGVRCSVVESQASAERLKFLQILLQHNGYKVLFQKNIPTPTKSQKTNDTETPVNSNVPDVFKIGVTEITFNVAIMIFSRKMKTLDEKVLLPSYWNQDDLEYEEWYWKFKR